MSCYKERPHSSLMLEYKESWVVYEGAKDVPSFVSRISSLQEMHAVPFQADLKSTRNAPPINSNEHIHSSIY